MPRLFKQALLAGCGLRQAHFPAKSHEQTVSRPSPVLNQASPVFGLAPLNYDPIVFILVLRARNVYKRRAI
jgi:hypothetical protein